MHTQVEKTKENKSKSVANSITQKKSNSKQGVGFVDNRSISIIQNKLETSISGHDSSYPIQKKADMTKRKNHKKKLEAVLKMLTEARNARGNQNGKEEEINAHDEVLHAGQHHGMRAVKLNQLISDIEVKIEEHTNNNLRDSDLLGVEKKAGRGDGGVAIQL